MADRRPFFAETSRQVVNGLCENDMVDGMRGEVFAEKLEYHEIGGVASEVDDNGFGILERLHDATSLCIGEPGCIDIACPVVEQQVAL